MGTGFAALRMDRWMLLEDPVPAVPDRTACRATAWVWKVGLVSPFKERVRSQTARHLGNV